MTASFTRLFLQMPSEAGWCFAFGLFSLIAAICAMAINFLKIFGKLRKFAALGLMAVSCGTAMIAGSIWAGCDPVTCGVYSEGKTGGFYGS